MTPSDLGNTESPGAVAATSPPTAVAQPVWLEPRPRRRFRVNLGQFMASLVYFAVLFLVGRGFFETGAPLYGTLTLAWAGLGIAGAGIWLLIRLRRNVLIGWSVFLLGDCLVTIAFLGTESLADFLGIDDLPGGLDSVPVPSRLAILPIGLLVATVVYLRFQARRNQQAGLLWVLALAVDRRLPLAPGVEAYAQGSRGVFGFWAHALAVGLDRGETLSEAVAAVPRVVARDAPILIRIGEQSGRLAEALRIAAESRSRQQGVLRDVVGRVAYLLVAAAVLVRIVLTLNLNVLPGYQGIMRMNETPMRPLTATVIAVAGWIEAHYGWLGGGTLAALGVVAASVAARGLAGLPVVGRVFRLRHKALLLRCLALAVAADQPLDRTCATLAGHYPGRSIRRRLGRAGRQLGRGVGWSEALRSVRLITVADVAVLDAAARAGNLAWALATLADLGERRFVYRLQVLTQALFVVALVGFAGAVLGVSLALFLPLIDLIEGMAG